jgi:integrase
MESASGQCFRTIPTLTKIALLEAIVADFQASTHPSPSTTQPKRSRGDGRIFPRGLTYWCAFYVDGKELRESCGTEDPKRAEKYLRDRLKAVHVHQADRAKPFITVRDRKTTIAKLMEALKTNFELRGKNSPQNLSNIKRVTEDLGHVRANDLGDAGVANYIHDQIEAGYAKATVNRLTETLRQGYALAKLPAPEFIKLDESDNVRRGFFSEQEVRRVLANLPAELADFTLFAWLTGMRKGEISSLRWEDVDGDSIRLRAESSKNGRARLIPLEGELGELLARRKQARQIKRKDTVMLAALIFHRKGEPIREFRKSWATACTKAGIRRLFHDLRRSSCRNMLAAGVPQAIAMEISGHRSPAMYRRYAIVAENDLRTALRATQQYLATVKENVIAMAASK